MVITNMKSCSNHKILSKNKQFLRVTFNWATITSYNDVSCRWPHSNCKKSTVQKSCQSSAPKIVILCALQNLESGLYCSSRTEGIFIVFLPKMGAVFGVCSAATCAANLACCCGSAACGLCCKACPTCKNSTSSRIVYTLFLLFGLITSCIVLIPGIRQELDKIPKFCEVRILSWFVFVRRDSWSVRVFIDL